MPGEAVTGHCLVLVTDDAERTMATHLGVASDFASVDLHDGHLSSAQVVYLEGYLWEQPSAKAAMREAIEVAHATRRRGGPHRVGPVLRRAPPGRVPRPAHAATSRCSSPTRKRSCLLFGAPTFEAAVEAVTETGVLAVADPGCRRMCGGHRRRGRSRYPAAPVDRVVDTTGAGDLFAAGFLYGITNGLSPEESARLGGVCAAEVISHVGARPQADLRELGRGRVC